MAAMTSWSMSWRHCSPIDGEVCGSGGSLRSCRVATSVVLVAIVGVGVAAMLAKDWHRGVAAPAVAVVRLPTRQDCLALEWEVASPFVSCSW
jgi:hypothetical protein